MERDLGRATPPIRLTVLDLGHFSGDFIPFGKAVEILNLLHRLIRNFVETRFSPRYPPIIILHVDIHIHRKNNLVNANAHEVAKSEFRFSRERSWLLATTHIRIV